MSLNRLTAQEAGNIQSPTRNFESVDISAADYSAPSGQFTKAIYVGGYGDVTVTNQDGDEVTFYACDAGTILPIRTNTIKDTSTATNMVALYNE